MHMEGNIYGRGLKISVEIRIIFTCSLDLTPAEKVTNTI